MLKIEWTDRITNGEVFQRAKGERLLLKILQNRRHSWIWHTVRHNEFWVNILEGAIFGEKEQWEDLDCNTYSKWTETAADSCTAMARMACNSCRWKAANDQKAEESEEEVPTCHENRHMKVVSL